MAINEGKLNEFLGKAVGDFGATMHAALVVIGDKLGLYKAMAGAGPLSPTPPNHEEERSDGDPMASLPSSQRRSEPPGGLGHAPAPERPAQNCQTGSRRLCDHCSAPFSAAGRRGEPRRYCSAACRRRAWVAGQVERLARVVMLEHLRTHYRARLAEVECELKRLR